MLLCDPSPGVAPDERSLTTEYRPTISEGYSEFYKALPFIFAIPKSNAKTERCFSLMNAVHTPVRNSLSLDTINSILNVKMNKRTPATVTDNKNQLLSKCKGASRSHNLQHKN